MLNRHIDDLSTIIDGINQSAKIISTTMGGHGKNVLMFKNGNLIFTKDGVSVAQEIGFSNIEQNIGHQLLMNAAKQTVKTCGDGTTLTSLLTSEFIKSMAEALSADVDFNLFIQDAKAEINKLKEYLIETSRKIESSEDIYNIALTSCKNPQLAEFIKNIYVKTGLDASITLEKTENRQTYTEHTVGLTFEEGYVNPGFANQDNGNCMFENPTFLILDEGLNEPSEIDEYVRACHSEKVPLVIICSSYSDLIVRYALSNKERGIRICLVKTPGWAESKKHNIKDIMAFLTSGSANRVTISPYNFTIFNNPPVKQIRARVKQLQSLIENAEEAWEVKEFQNRIANIQQKSAIIYVGGNTAEQAKEEFDRIEDAVGAVKSASSLGFQTGVGVSLYNYNDCPNWLSKVLKSPHTTIMTNARLQVTGTPINTKTREEDQNLIDPTLVLVSAIENAFSLTQLLLTTGYAIYEV